MEPSVIAEEICLFTVGGMLIVGITCTDKLTWLYESLEHISSIEQSSNLVLMSFLMGGITWSFKYLERLRQKFFILCLPLKSAYRRNLTLPIFKTKVLDFVQQKRKQSRNWQWNNNHTIIHSLPQSLIDSLTFCWVTDRRGQRMTDEDGGARRLAGGRGQGDGMRDDDAEWVTMP